MKISSFKDCCGCMACLNACPVDAIKVIEDKMGFQYPKINTKKCIKCGKCVKTCNYSENSNRNIPLNAFAAVAKNKDILQMSASGGVFSALALSVIENGGIVYGAAMVKENNQLITKHIRCDSIAELKKLAGSKYVQSNSESIYKYVKKDLQQGLFVLFSGTPCQVDGLNGYLGKKVKNLLSIDLICHGVPSNSFFNGYLHHFEKKMQCTINEIRFRDKAFGWDLMGSYRFLDKNGEEHVSVLDSKLSSYYQFFLGSDIYRDNCYSCKYAQIERCSDITIGDFWGIEDAHPSYLTENGGSIDAKEGVSCILANTEKGRSFIEANKQLFLLYESTIEKVQKVNRQLNKPSEKGKHRKIVLFLYKSVGYGGVEKYWRFCEFIKKLKENIKKIIRR